MKAGGSLASETYASLLGMETDAQRFREEAEECRKLAYRAINPLDKEAWLKLAAEWIKLAQGADRKRRF